jgi:hypothetical protein
MLAHFVNGSGSYIKRALFNITLYNYSDEIIDIQQVSINNLGPNESRPVKKFFECPNKDDIKDIDLKFITILK